MPESTDWDRRTKEALDTIFSRLDELDADTKELLEVTQATKKPSPLPPFPCAADPAAILDTFLDELQHL